MTNYNYVLQKCYMIAKDYNTAVYSALIWLLYESGSRISAILKVRACDITARGAIIIRQGKGSETLICQPSKFRDYFLNAKDTGVIGWENVNYTMMYRICKKYRIFEGMNFGRNRAVTAGARKELAKEVYTTSKDINVAKRALGHKKASSTEYYISDDNTEGELHQGVLNNYTGIVNNLVITREGVIRKKPTRTKYIQKW